MTNEKGRGMLPRPRILTAEPAIDHRILRLASGDNDRGVCTGSTDQPGQKKNTGETDHCLGGYAPAGPLNAIVHEIPV
jgi:hypothetical protein